MFEMHITITAPDLSNAINNLAAAMGSNKQNVVATQPPIAAPASVSAPVMVQDPVQIPEAIPETVQAVADTTTSPAVTQQAEVITFDALTKAGAELVDKGKMTELIGVLKRYGVQAVPQLKEDQYAAVASDLRALGATL